MILILALALAAAPVGDPVGDACLENAHTQPEIDVCANAEWSRADAALNEAYRAALARVRADSNYMDTSDGRAAGDVLLRDAQRAWITQREQMCQFESYDMRGGSGEPSVYDRCRAEVTRERTAWLQQLARAGAQ